MKNSKNEEPTAPGPAGDPGSGPGPVFRRPARENPRRRLSRRPAVLAALFVFLGTGTFYGDVPKKARFPFSFKQNGNDCRFQGSFNVPADPRTAWGVLTDFNDRSKFISNVNCHVRQKGKDGLLVDLTVGGGFLFIREEVKGLLRIEETPMKSLTFEEISRKKFSHFGGDWKLQPGSPAGSLKVTFDLDADLNRSTPSFVTPDLLRQASVDFMKQMRREMVRRMAFEKPTGGNARGN